MVRDILPVPAGTKWYYQLCLWYLDRDPHSIAWCNSFDLGCPMESELSFVKFCHIPINIILLIFLYKYCLKWELSVVLKIENRVTQSICNFCFYCFWHCWLVGWHCLWFVKLYKWITYILLVYVDGHLIKMFLYIFYLQISWYYLAISFYFTTKYNIMEFCCLFGKLEFGEWRFWDYVARFFYHY